MLSLYVLVPPVWTEGVLTLLNRQACEHPLHNVKALEKLRCLLPPEDVYLQILPSRGLGVGS